MTLKLQGVSKIQQNQYGSSTRWFSGCPEGLKPALQSVPLAGIVLQKGCAEHYCPPKNVGKPGIAREEGCPAPVQRRSL